MDIYSLMGLFVKLNEYSNNFSVHINKLLLIIIKTPESHCKKQEFLLKKADHISVHLSDCYFNYS